MSNKTNDNLSQNPNCCDLVKGKINISIDFIFDAITQNLELGTINKEIIQSTNSPIPVPPIVRTLTRSEKVYYILTLGSGPLCEYLFPCSTLKIIYKKGDDSSEQNPYYTGMLHSKIPGRIGGIAALYKDNPELLEDTVTIKATYLIDQKTLQIEKV